MLTNIAHAVCGMHNAPVLGCADCHAQLMSYAEDLEHDAMTGLLQRDVGLALAARLARRRSCAVVYVDVDNLKAHNNRARSQGNRAIGAAAQATSAACRAGDLAIRLGGDEMLYFGVVSEQGDGSDLRTRRIAERIARRIERTVRENTGGSVTVSCGSAVFDIEHGNLEALVDRMAAEAEGRKAAKRAADVAEHDAPITPIGARP